MRLTAVPHVLFLKEYEYCSDRGTCNFKTGECSCDDGFGGLACELTNHVYTHTTNTGVAEQVLIHSLTCLTSYLLPCCLPTCMLTHSNVKRYER